MDILIKMLIKAEFDVFLSNDVTMVTKDDVTLGMALCEEQDRRRRLKAVDHDLDEYYEFGYRLFDRRPFPSGKLTFSIDGLGFESLSRKFWRDTDSKSLEDCLKGIILGFIRTATLKKKSLLKKEEGGEEE